MPAAANPLGAQVVGGSATVQGQGTPTVTITQQSNSAIINWNTFNIGAGEKTKIIMPSSSSVQLDRVTGGLGPSQIFGTLSSNGRVFLVNPDGILFGPGAVVDTAGFLATTHDIANTDFMAGRYNFSIPGRQGASVVNFGTITARDSGFAALVAPGVRNSGTITANLGTVALASGNGFSLDLYGDKLITLNVNDAIAASVKDVATGQPLGMLVTNDGKIKANGGRVELTAVAARQVVDSVINNSGLIEANTIGQRDGKIVLSAATAATKPANAPPQTISVSGKLSAAGKKKGSAGGTIQVTGEAIALSGATLDASGRNGGGTVLIGGDVGGGHPNAAVAFIPQAQLQPYAVANASNVKVDSATSINASAKDSGNGGKVVVWSDGTTAFGGAIKATGGANIGNGGFVEVSGHQSLSYFGLTNTFAGLGKNGTLLLDPLNTTIDVVGGHGIVTVAAVQNALANNNVVVTSGASGSEAGDLTVAAPISWANANALTLSAYRNVAVNANITNIGGAAVNLVADNTGTGIGTVSFGAGATISTAGPVSIFYNPSVNPFGSGVNVTSYVNPIENYAGNVAGGGALTAYMLVNTGSDLQNIKNNLSGVYGLSTDIDVSTALALGPFTGVLTGQNHTLRNITNVGVSPFQNNFGTIKDLKIVNFSVTANGSGQQLGFVGANLGTLSNVVLLNDTVDAAGYAGVISGGLAGRNEGLLRGSSASGTVSGSIVGGLVGLNHGSLLNSSAAGSVSCPTSDCITAGGLVGANYATVAGVTDGLISQSFSTASVSISVPNVGGGLVGENGGAFPLTASTITQSYSTGTVSTTTTGGWLGGLVGMNFQLGVVDQSYSISPVIGGAGTVVGGLVGRHYESTITKSYAAGSLSTGAGGSVGGLIGDIVSGTTGSPNVFQSLYWDSQSTGQGAAVGSNVIGANTSALVSKTTTELKSSLPSGFDSSVWALSGSVNAGYPYLQWQTATAPSTITTTLPSAVLTVGTLPSSVPVDVFSTGQVKYFASDTQPVSTPLLVTEDEIRIESAKLLTRLSTNEVYDFVQLSGSFDSKFHSFENNQRQFVFRGRVITGSDLNYYFEGRLFAAYGIPQSALNASMRFWKQWQYRVQPSENAFWAARQGYSDGRSN
jgi:filamentous hemagglutinin family protein